MGAVPVVLPKTDFGKALPLFEELLDDVHKIQLTKENNMLTLKKTTLINGTDCDDTTTAEILNYIDAEQVRVDRLQMTLAGSKSLTKLTKKHKENIVALIKIIDARPAE